MPLSSQLLHERLRGAAKRFRLARAARGVMSGAAVALAFLFVFLLADAQFHFNPAGRWMGFLLVLAPVLAGLAAAFRAALPSISEASMARRIETVSGEARNDLISAVQFDRELAPQSALRAALFEEMRDPFPKVNWSRVFDLKLLRKLAWMLAATVGILGISAWIRPLMFANSAVRILLPASNVAPLTRTQFASITPGDVRVIHGKALTITATLTGEIPRVAWIYWRAAGGGSWRKALMDHETAAAAFSYDFRELNEPLDYTIEAGDATSAAYRVAVRPRTGIRTRLAEVTLPAYARRALNSEGKSVLKDFAVLQNVLPGSRVAVTLEFNNPVAQLSARVPLEQSPQFKTEKLGENRWRFSGTVPASETVRLDYRDADDLADNDSVQIAVAAVEPPKIVISEPAEGKELLAAPGATLRIRFKATADFGLGGVALYRSSDEAPDGTLLADWKEAAGHNSFAREAAIPLAPFGKEERVTFCVAAKDRNDVSGPGITYSRPIVVTLRSADALAWKENDTAKKLQGGLAALIKLQQTNLEASSAAARGDARPPALKPLLERQTQIGDQGRGLAASTELLAPATRAELQTLSQNEMPAAVLALRDAAAGADEGRTQSLAGAVKLESAILARLRGASKSLETETARSRVRDLIAGLEDLLRKQRDLLHDTNSAKPDAGGALADRQDALAGDATQVRLQLDANSQNAAMGDEDFRARLARGAAMFSEARLYEQMLDAAEKLEATSFPAAVATQKGVIANLAKIVELLNQWQFANAGRESDTLKKAAHDMAGKLEKLAATQREVIEKSKEPARKGEVNAGAAATARQIKEAKDEMAGAVEQMLTDAHIFPDLKPCNELRGELTQVYEDVIQTDKELAAAGKLEAQEVAVQKEDSILQAIEQAKKIAQDIEMWLPDKNDTTKWELENFDKSEMPDVANLPLPDAFSDLVGDLLKEQKGLEEQARDAASNQVMAENDANGWQVTDGAQAGFGAQGKSGNTAPKKNEQTGRSSGGREGESTGEMVGNTAGNLEGTKPDARRTNDPMQQGHVKDDGSVGQTRATGGGKAGGFSDRNGMEGNAPLRPVNAGPIGATDALAVQQALLAEKTSRMNAQATLLYLKATALPDVARLMDQAQAALKEGRMQDFRGLHQKIVARLNEVRGALQPGNVVSFTTGDSARAYDKQLLGGDEGQAPPAYKQAVADYYRSLLEDK